MNSVVYSVCVIFMSALASIIELCIGYYHRDDLIKTLQLCKNHNKENASVAIPQKDRMTWRIVGISLTFGTLLVCLLQNFYHILLETARLIAIDHQNTSSGIESDLFCTVIIQLMFMAFYAIKTLLYGVLISRVKMAQVKTKYVSHSLNRVIYLFSFY